LVFVLDLAFGFWVRFGDLVLGQNNFMGCLWEKRRGRRTFQVEGLGNDRMFRGGMSVGSFLL
jgi:hypothetical protein